MSNTSGAFSSVSAVRGGGNLGVEGTFVALRGYRLSDDPEVWYDWGRRTGALSTPPLERARNTWHEVQVN